MSDDGLGRLARPAAARLGGTQQLSDRVAAYLREAIMVGELEPSSFIRMEHVASRLGVSATPVREALMILHSEGAVRWEPRRGFRVVPLDRQDVDDLFAVQAYIAGELAARAAQILPAEETAGIRGVQAELEAAAARGEAARVDELNHEIHRTINRAAGAHRLTSMLNLFVHYVPRNYYGQVPGWSDATTHDHEAIFAALEARDPDAARAAMTEHIRHIGRLLSEHLQGKGVFDRGRAVERAG
ncbi:GntR family transcriptional regulator [Pseudonocardia acidicola]|uniref:GntR family transcriptional regulator n=1 Tax=Pseudonocardia acidicola TaxID=2724939 RepID=A0ABX1SCK5_9PSEU|nr:GntR family transcriptional regulator [Pseudonocardia acidicola]NMH97918.1 GntR family transcriptional regulator [Pseudonocardia acidicola]